MGLELSVVYCGNRKSFPLILLSVLSLTEKTSVPVNVYLVTMDLSAVDPAYLPITEGQRAVLQEVLKEIGGAAFLLRADQEYERSLRGSKNEKSYYTPYAQLRLFLDRFPLPDRVLYLDTDVMCCRDPVCLFSHSLHEYEISAVRDHMGKHFFGKNYFNSGVMELNLPEIKRTELFRRVLERVRKRKMMFADQTTLNRCATKVLLLPRAFNEQRAPREDTVFKHFCRGIQWFPLFRVYNIKQTEREKVRKFLKITQFESVYGRFDEIAATYNIK